MTIHITLMGILALMGGIAAGLVLVRFLIYALMLWRWGK